MKDDLFSQLYENIKKIGLTKWIMLGIAGVLLIASSYLKKDMSAFRSVDLPAFV